MAQTRKYSELSTGKPARWHQKRVSSGFGTKDLPGSQKIILELNPTIRKTKPTCGQLTAGRIGRTIDAPQTGHDRRIFNKFFYYQLHRKRKCPDSKIHPQSYPLEQF